MTAPERIWARPDYNECWPKRLEEEDVEYIRADLAAVQPASQCCMCGKEGLSTSEHDGGAECELHDGRWVCSRRCYDAAYSMMVPALEPQPDPRDEVIKGLVEALDNLLEAITTEDRFHDRSLTITGPTYNLKWLLEAEEDARAALAAAKAVQHG